MEILSYVFVFTFGAVIGSFLNVVLYRFHTGKSLDGRSHCLSCGKTLSWYELFPIFSYLLQLGKCRGCASTISSRYLAVEFLTGVLFCISWYFFALMPLLLLIHVVLMVLLVLIVVYDIRHTIIPDEFTCGVGLVALAYLGVLFFETHDYMLVFSALAAGLGAAAFLGGLWYISKGRWIGFGDAKLALPLGALVGLTGVFSMIVLSFWIGAAISLTLLGIERLLKRGKTHLHFLGTPLTIKSEVPFAPFLILGFLIVHLLHADIFTITYALFFSY